MSNPREVTESGTDALVNLALLADQMGILGDLVQQEVKRAIAGGVTWREVGEALRVSAQAAWEHYSASSRS